MSSSAASLPAHRPDLLIRPVSDDGQHIVKDVRTGDYYRLGPQESFLLRAFGKNEKMGLFSGISVIISERS
jgi:hypothetical protein